MSGSTDTVRVQGAPRDTSRADRVALIVAFATFATSCALNRSDVKSVRDREASRIRLDTTIETTIAALNAIPAHCGPSRDPRVRDEEFHVYQVVGRIGRVKRESDHDIHIVLEDPDNPRAHLIVESDDPDSRGNIQSPYRDRLVVARHMFEELARPSRAKDLKDLRGIAVRVTGIEFFDLNHFQIGRSRSCIEPHPILGIERVREYSTGRVPDGRLEKSPQALRSPQARGRTLVARAALSGLFVLRHIGLGPHVHATVPDTLDTVEVAQLWTEPADLEGRDLLSGPWGMDAAPNRDDVYSFVAETNARELPPRFQRTALDCQQPRDPIAARPSDADARRRIRR
jgi:hypothetical protein